MKCLKTKHAGRGLSFKVIKTTFNEHGAILSVRSIFIFSLYTGSKMSSTKLQFTSAPDQLIKLDFGGFRLFDSKTGRTELVLMKQLNASTVSVCVPLKCFRVEFSSKSSYDFI